MFTNILSEIRTCVNIIHLYSYALSYYHYQIGSLNYYLLFRIWSWNNKVRCMYFCILIHLTGYWRMKLLIHALKHPWMLRHEWVMLQMHDDVIKWKYFPRYWPFVRGIHRSPLNSPHKGQWRGALMFTLISARINGWVNNREAGDLRRYRLHYDVIVMGV